MKVLAYALLLLAFGVVAATSAESPEAASANNLSCTVGPLAKTFGKTEWLVYACDDGRSVVVVSAAGNPAMPFYFFFVFGSDGLELHGEGTGDKRATAAAFGELKTLGEVDVAALFAAAKVASTAK